ncbi:AAA domain-containing protein [Bacillus sp. AG236]|nr:AAA domain-containing protein [Bacillus sp. AG236]
MSKFGFYIHKLIVIGKNVNDVFVEFKKGLNIISGPSDTGKSYIFECINYMLGSSTEPKKIKEGKEYSSILMEIVLYNGETYTFKRSFGKNKVEVYRSLSHLISGVIPIILDVKHNKDTTDNLSTFLLDKSGYKHPSYVKKNKKGDTRTLSFRDLPIYITISEDKIIKTDSPILSGQFINATVEKSIFKLIISGLEDNEDKNIQEENISSITKLEGQKELLDRLINQEEKELVALGINNLTNESILENKMKEIEGELEKLNQEIEHQTTNRRTLWNEIEENKSRSIAVLELIKRFKLLKEHYDSDLNRLNFIIEGNYYFSQLNFSVCPYCNQRVENENCNINNCGFNHQNNNDLVISAEAEITKIKLQLLDLESTIEQSEIEYNELINKIEGNQIEYDGINERINQILEPQELNLQASLSSYIQERDLVTKYKLILLKKEDLNNQKTLIENKLKKKPKPKTKLEDNGLELSLYNKFCSYMSRTLKRWKFSESPDVVYKDGDFYIDSKPTKDYGKGYRAIIYSAFAISLMEYSKGNNRPHPGFVLLDSPLTTYKGKKSEEDVNGDIQSAFFNDVISLQDEMQIIILENKEPSDEIKEKINYIQFTKDTNNGRYGFFVKKG